MRFILIACLGCLACSSDPPEGDRYRSLLKRRAADAAPAPRTDPIAERLRAIADGYAAHPYFGSVTRDRIRAHLAAMPPDAPPEARVRAMVPLAVHEMYAGEIERAVALLQEARRLVAPGSRTEATVEFHAAVAWLRLGEVRNCIDRHARESCIAPIRGAGQHVDKRGSEGAMAGLRRVLAHPHSTVPMKLTARWLLNIAAMTLDLWPDGLEPALRIPLEAYGAGASQHFTNISAGLGLGRSSLAGGAVVDDFDGDGDLDIIVSSWDVRARLFYYRNDGGRFVERGVAAGLVDQLGGLNLEHADYDGDGDLDLLVLRGAWLGGAGEHPNSLLQNDGTGRFTDVTIEVGLGVAHHPTHGAAFGDYDNDGDLDLYVANESIPGSRRPSQLFRNDGGRFTDVAAAAGVLNHGYAKAAAWGDYDGDDDLDLYVSNLAGPNRLYRNDGGRFTDVAAQLGVTGPKDSFPAWFWDYDNDGHLDIAAWHGFVQTPNAPPVPPVWVVAADAVGAPHDGQRPALYRGDGRGGFTNVTAAAGLERAFLVMGSNHGDLDGDGRPDVYLGTGYPGYEGLMPNIALHNREGRFVDVSASAGLAHLQKGHGVAFADLDHDGDLDLFAELGGAFAGDAFADALFENPGAGNHWLVVELRGRGSNRFGMGVRLRADLVEAGVRRSVHRSVDNGGSFGGNPWRQHLGLGKATRVERLEIYWPTTRTRQVFEGVAADQAIRVTEGAAEYEKRSYPALPFAPQPTHRSHP